MSKPQPKTLPPSEIEAHVKTILSRTQPAAGASLLTLRLAAGISQRQLGSVVHRKRSTITAWEKGRTWPPSDDLWPAILDRLGVSSEIIARSFLADLDGDLDSRLYARFDADEIEHRFFLRTRGQILQKVKEMAMAKHPKGIEIYERWMLRAEERVVARRSTPRDVRALPAAREAWQAQALLATESQPEESQSTDTPTCSAPVDQGDGPLDTSPQVADTIEPQVLQDSETESSAINDLHDDELAK